MIGARSPHSERWRHVLRPATILAPGLFLLLAGAGCATSRVDAGPTDNRSTTSAAASENTSSYCQRVTETDTSLQLLTRSEVTKEDAGSSTVLTTDYSRCAPTDQTVWRCEQGFPWQTTATVGPVMAGLHVRASQQRSIRTLTGSITETLLTLGHGQATAAGIARTMSTACPGAITGSPGHWQQTSDSTTVIVPGNDRVLVMDFRGDFKDADNRTSLVDTALRKAQL